jgi:glycosyltransferase involved in cell wall biosynthesis
MKILFLSRWFPFPADNGSKIRIHNLLRGLSKSHDVTLLSFYDPEEVSLEEVKKYSFCSQVHVVAWKPFNEMSAKASLGFFSQTPRSLLDTYSPEMESLIRRSIASQKFDIVIASQLTMASYYPAFEGLPAIFEEIELGLYMDQPSDHGNWIQRIRLHLTWLKLKRYFHRLLDSFRIGTVVSEQEYRIFSENFPNYCQRIEVFPNCINMEEYQGLGPLPKKYQLVFSGSSRYLPNYRAIEWFLGNVYPLILKQNPKVQLVITGDQENLSLPAAGNVTLSGHVDDIKSLIAAGCISIVPLWSGGGTRLKILEAMALGTAVVATSKGAEGLLVEHGEHLLIGDEPQAFADSVMRLLDDDDLRHRLSAQAKQLVKTHYDWSILMPVFLDLVEKVSAQEFSRWIS